jgi:hypothetical protein
MTGSPGATCVPTYSDGVVARATTAPAPSSLSAIAFVPSHAQS